ncbi:guanylate cyclase soluble subunit beta-2-like [Mytilus edulis]|uniref:guanylate cyclase soluble subunit beta-2-like n=1 Tax=Mytilus edulis TaxID=6550 RepID=UPI0039F0219A
MYGHIHLCIKELVLDKFGQEVWDKILEKSVLHEGTDFLVFQSYHDDKTFALVGAVCAVSGIPLDTVLEVFGEYFVQYCFRHGYDQLLRTLGKDFISFIQNLDALHANLQRTYSKLRPPSFRCERKDADSVYLHYFTERTGLHPIVKGVVKVVAREIYNQVAEMEVISISKQQIEGGLDQEHVIFLVKLKDIDKKKIPDNCLNVFQSNGSQTSLNTSHFCKAFPYHIVFDENLEIKQCGDMIPKILHMCLKANTSMTTLFDITHPPMKFKLENILTFINSVFYLGVKNNKNAETRLFLRGQMLWIDDLRLMMYVCSPRLSSLLELKQLNIYLSDIPLYDVTRELILLNQQRIAEIDIAKKLDETTAELKITSRLLAEEKQKTDNLLFQMLPQKVADELKNGRTVKAEKFADVTVLFSDIVTFTDIAAACTPLDIVRMLNELYQRFDARTSEHDVYKVETIGDAYMVVSGVPEAKKVHAQPIAKFAIDMIKEASNVKSPATGKPLQIRVGIHSGPVVAGVVGVKMPRYCLFGDTVNTASRMESHGEPGRIHISPTSYSLLKDDHYVFRDRQCIEVKGKGSLHTYFLVGENGKLLSEPEDIFRNLSILKNDIPVNGSVTETVSYDNYNDEITPIKINVVLQDDGQIPRNNSNIVDRETKNLKTRSRTSTMCNLL